MLFLVQLPIRICYLELEVREPQRRLREDFTFALLNSDFDF